MQANKTVDVVISTNQKFYETNSFHIKYFFLFIFFILFDAIKTIQESVVILKQINIKNENEMKRTENKNTPTI